MPRLSTYHNTFRDQSYETMLHHRAHVLMMNNTRSGHRSV